jgi:hypothetical protein
MPQMTRRLAACNANADRGHQLVTASRKGIDYYCDPAADAQNNVGSTKSLAGSG